MEIKANWEEELAIIKSILIKTGLTPTIKWGAEVYCYEGKNVVSYGSFKHYFALWFYNGVFLKDEHKVLVNAQVGVTKALRQWRFSSREEIDENLILAYTCEAIQNEQEGKTWKPQKSPEVKIPDLLLTAFNTNKELQKAFHLLPLYKQKDYLEHINTAKRIETQLSRIEKITPMIIDGIGLNDKYKNRG